MSNAWRDKAPAVLAAIQIVLGVRVCLRLARTAGGIRIHRSDATDPDRVTVIVPVLNERKRLAPCLDGLLAQPDTVADILVVDGGSEDGTQDLVRQFMARDARLNLIDASPVPRGVNGKAYGLQLGLEHALPESGWILTIDADVRPAPDLASSLLAHTRKTGVLAFSVAIHQRLSGMAAGIVHPSLRASLVYRFGIPGHATDEVAMVQASGQCFLIERETLERVGGFAGVLDSVREDITLARELANAGYPVGFYESDGLIETVMDGGWHDALVNWTRALPLWERYAGWHFALGFGEVLLVQALPLPLTVGLGMTGHRGPTWLVNVALSLMRIGALAGMARAYPRRPWTYWLSPLADLAIATRLIMSAARRSHTCRGRPLQRGDGAAQRDDELG